jgi:hypothetical protein
MPPIKERDRGWASIETEVRRSDDWQLLVGLFDPDLATRGAFQEFGSATIPQRPFLRSTMDSERGSIGAEMERISKLILDGKSSARREFEKLGQSLVPKVQRTIEQWTSPGNAPSTIARKGRDDPLVDTKAMLQGVTFRVLPPGELEEER